MCHQPIAVKQRVVLLHDCAYVATMKHEHDSTGVNQEPASSACNFVALRTRHNCGRPIFSHPNTHLGATDDHADERALVGAESLHSSIEASRKVQLRVLGAPHYIKCTIRIVGKKASVSPLSYAFKNRMRVCSFTSHETAP